MENLAAPEAVLAAQKFVLEKEKEKEKENQKIVVSDDEDESDSDDSSSDSEDSDESEDGDDGRDDIEIEQLPPIAFEVLSISDIYSASEAGASQAGASQAGASQAGASQAGAIEVGAIEVGAIEVGASEADTSIIEVMDDTLNLVNLLNVGTDATKSESYDQMRVDDLRKIVSDKNLATKDDVKKLKKPELLVLLKK